MSKFYKLEQKHFDAINELSEYANMGVGLNDVKRTMIKLQDCFKMPYSYEDVEKEHEKVKENEEKSKKQQQKTESCDGSVNDKLI